MDLKLKCLIVDDEQAAHYVLENYIARVDHLECAGSCYTITECISFIHRNPVDLIFLDINMPEISGLELLRSIPTLPPIILTTAHSDHALESYEYGVVDYLLKPFPFTRFLKAVHKLSVSAQHGATAAPEHKAKNQELLLKVNGELLKIRQEDIMYIQSWGNYVKVMVQGTMHLSPITTTDLEKKLLPGQFLRIHKSYIINLSVVDKIKGNTVCLRDSTELPIGITHRRELIERLRGTSDLGL